MPLFLNTKGQPTLGIAICARCQRKFPLAQLMPDRNIPSLMVCADDRDELNAYALPARTPDPITLPYVRPDVSIAIDPAVAEAASASLLPTD
jgi:hypothetical protein